MGLRRVKKSNATDWSAKNGTDRNDPNKLSVGFTALGSTRLSLIAILTLMVVGYILSYIYPAKQIADEIYVHLPRISTHSERHTRDEQNYVSELDSHIDQELAHHVPPNDTQHEDGRTDHAHQPAHHVHIDAIVRHVLSKSPVLPPVPVSECKNMPVLDNGDCQVVGLRRPSWACPDMIRKALVEFKATVFDKVQGKSKEKRIEKMKSHVDELFAIWYMLRHMRPTISTVVVENAHVLRRRAIRYALPNAQIISVNARNGTSSMAAMRHGVHVIKGKTFKDVDWNAEEIRNKTETVVILENGNDRTLVDTRRHGLHRFIMLSNREYLRGREVSMKWACETRRKEKWKGIVSYDMGSSIERQTWEEHEKIAMNTVRAWVHLYYEMPPIVSARLSGSTRFDDASTSAALISSVGELRAVFGTDLDVSDLKGYKHTCYVETV